MKPENETKQKLLIVALDLIWEHSYGSVSVDDICKQAGVLKGSFYHFFPSKSDLTVAALEEYFLTRRPLLDRVFSPQMAPVDRLLAYCDQVYEIQSQRFNQSGKVGGCPFCSVGSELSTQDENVRKKIEEVGRRIRMYFESALRDAARDGLTSADDIPGRSMEFYSFITGTLLQARITNNLELLLTLKPVMRNLLQLEKQRGAQAAPKELTT